MTEFKFILFLLANTLSVSNFAILVKKYYQMSSYASNVNMTNFIFSKTFHFVFRKKTKKQKQNKQTKKVFFRKNKNATVEPPSSDHPKCQA